jgi:hypothetical protein
MVKRQAAGFDTMLEGDRQAVKARLINDVHEVRVGAEFPARALDLDFPDRRRTYERLFGSRYRGL